MLDHKIEISQQDYNDYTVCYGDKESARLTYEEMLGLVVSISFPRSDNPMKTWLRTEEENRELGLASAEEKTFQPVALISPVKNITDQVRQEFK